MTQSALITGASSGIGEACAHWFASKGWNILLCSRDGNKLSDLCLVLTQKYGINCYYHCADLTDSSTIKPLFLEVNKKLGSLDTLIHSAGSLAQGPLITIKEDDIDQQFNIHLKSSLLLAQLACRVMVKNKKGTMVFISSTVANQGAVGQALYSAAKSGLHGMVKSLSKELGQHNIRVNAVAPGFIETALVNEYTDSQRQQLTQATSLKRLGKADEVAQAIGFLASKQSSYITGQILPVDAGLTL